MTDFNAWLVANGFDPEAVSDAQKLVLQAAWRASLKPAEPAPAPAPVAANPANPGAPVQSPYEAAIQAAEREGERQEAIRQMTLQAIDRVRGFPDQIRDVRSFGDAALADPNCTAQKFQLDMLRYRPGGPVVYSPSQPKVTSEVVEAAVCLAHRLPNVEKAFDEKTLETAHRQFRRGISLKRLLTMGAQANGYRGDDADFGGVCRAALRSAGDGYSPMADAGVSTGVQVPGILSNTANKFLAASFMMVENAWRGIAKIRSVNDFKQITTYRMAGNNTFLRVAPGGELKHGALSETSYTNQAKTYGRILGISREDYINDDLGAFINVTSELGRGAADALNNIFWAAWLDDSNFFNTDGSKNNYDAGATDSVLSLAGLDNAETIFKTQTKPDGTPLGATPRILLVPTALANTALTLMSSMVTNMATSTVALTGNANVFAGRYRVVESAFLSRTSLPDENGVSQTVTGSSTAWYLLADPMDIPAIEVCFLFGRDTPTVETDQFEFDRLGLATRAFFDFGVNKQEYRAGVKLKGAA